MAMVKEYQEHCALKEAITLLLSSFSQLNPVKIPVQEALGYSIAEDILSNRNVPHYTASAVDGYAITSDKTVNATPATPRILCAEEYIWVNTGSAVPGSADTVVMVEDTSLDGAQLTVRKALTPGTNVRAVGEDVMVGQLLAHKGETLTPSLLPLLLCSGIESVPVFKKPAIVFSIKDDKAKGSARGIGDVDILELIRSQEDILLGFGGHKGAAGVSIEVQHLERFRTNLVEAARSLSQESMDADGDLLGEISVDQIDFELLEILENQEPYGQKNPKPSFLLRNILVKVDRLIGKDGQHLKLILQEGSVALEALFFNYDVKAKQGDRISNSQESGYIQILVGRYAS